MRLRIPKLRDRLLTLVFIVAWLVIFAALFLEAGVFYFGPGVQIFSISLLAGALLAFLFLGWRWTRFRKQAHGLLRLLVTGDYEVGLRVSKHWRDEITELEELFNKLTEQLRQYDELRTKRIRQLRMTLDLILEHTQEPMVLFEVDKSVLTFN
ncbi:MAG: hypothetical protein U9Q79_06845, partial [Candidatus Hydrogenedentes bacterium]|nr:hypothetical protein [Candidatus Hydrogenedentota bacterium]